MQRDVQFMANLAIACMHIDKMMLPVCFLIWKSFRFEFQLSNAKTRHYLKWHCQFLCTVIYYPISPYVPYALLYLILISNKKRNSYANVIIRMYIWHGWIWFLRIFVIPTQWQGIFEVIRTNFQMRDFFLVSDYICRGVYKCAWTRADLLISYFPYEWTFIDT